MYASKSAGPTAFPDRSGGQLPYRLYIHLPRSKRRLRSSDRVCRHGLPSQKVGDGIEEQLSRIAFRQELIHELQTGRPFCCS